MCLANLAGCSLQLFQKHPIILTAPAIAAQAQDMLGFWIVTFIVHPEVDKFTIDLPAPISVATLDNTD